MWEQAGAQAEAPFPARAGEAGAGWARSSRLLFLLGCSEAGQGRRALGQRVVTAVPPSGPGTRGLRTQREKAPAVGLL